MEGKTGIERQNVKEMKERGKRRRASKRARDVE